MSPVNILCLNASPRKEGFTQKALESTIKGIKEANGNFKLVYLADLKLAPCRGCFSTSPSSCKLTCPIDDDGNELVKEVAKSDGVIFASPVYWGSESSLMKMLIERLTCLENMSLINGKPAGVILTEDGEGGWNAASSLLMTLNAMGFLIPPFGVAIIQNIQYRPLIKMGLKIFCRNLYKEMWNEQDLIQLGKTIAKYALYIRAKMSKLLNRCDLNTN